MSVKQAVILAGGRGERLKPFTDEHPKPMYPVQGVPFIDRLVSQVKGFGIEKVTGRNVAGKIIEYVERNATRTIRKDRIGA